MTPRLVADERVRDLPPSATAVYLALRDLDGAVPARRVIEETGLAEMTARTALLELVGEGVVERRPAGDDVRAQFVFALPE